MVVRQLKKFDLWETLFWLSLAIFMGWAIAKSIGLIQSPVWMEIGIPALSAGIFIGSFYQKFKELIRQFMALEKRTGRIEKSVDETNNRLEGLEVKVDDVEKKLGIMPT